MLAISLKKICSISLKKELSNFFPKDELNILEKGFVSTSLKKELSNFFPKDELNILEKRFVQYP